MKTSQTQQLSAIVGTAFSGTLLAVNLFDSRSLVSRQIELPRRNRTLLGIPGFGAALDRRAAPQGLRDRDAAIIWSRAPSHRRGAFSTRRSFRLAVVIRVGYLLRIIRNK